MKLLNKLTNKLKYTQPEVEMVNLNVADIITSSGEMAEIEFAKKGKKKEKTEVVAPKIEEKNMLN